MTGLVVQGHNYDPIILFLRYFYICEYVWVVPTCFSFLSACVETLSWPLCWLLVHSQHTYIWQERQKNSCRYLCSGQIFWLRSLVGAISSWFFSFSCMLWGFRWVSQNDAMHTKHVFTAALGSGQRSQGTAEPGSFFDAPLLRVRARSDAEDAALRALLMDSRPVELRAPRRSCSTASASMVFLQRVGRGLKVCRHSGQL